MICLFRYRKRWK